MFQVKPFSLDMNIYPDKSTLESASSKRQHRYFIQFMPTLWNINVIWTRLHILYILIMYLEAIVLEITDKSTEKYFTTYTSE